MKKEGLLGGGSFISQCGVTFHKIMTETRGGGDKKGDYTVNVLISVN